MRAPTTQSYIDQPVVIAITLGVGIAGAYTTIVMPMIVSGIGDALHLAAGGASSIAASEMAGVAAGSGAASFRIGRDDRSRWVIAGAGIAVFANLACVHTANLPLLLLLRFIAGTGGGCLLAVMAATVGATSQADRNFAIFVAAAFLIATLTFRVVPGIVAGSGVNTLFYLLVSINAAAAAVAWWFPARRPHDLTSPHAIAGGQSPTVSGNMDASHRSARPVMLALGGILAYYIGVGGVWPLMGRIGATLHLTAPAVNQVLSLASFGAMTGALGAAMLGTRLGRRGTVVVGLSSVVGALTWLLVARSAAAFSAAPVLFLFCWNFTVPFLMGTVAALDVTGRAVAFNMTLQYIGFAVGPLLAAGIARQADLISVLWLGIAGVSASAMLFDFAMHPEKIES